MALENGNLDLDSNLLEENFKLPDLKKKIKKN